MTDDERIELLVAAAPRPTREQVAKLALLLAGIDRSPKKRTARDAERAA